MENTVFSPAQNNSLSRAEGSHCCTCYRHSKGYRYSKFVAVPFTCTFSNVHFVPSQGYWKWNVQQGWLLKCVHFWCGNMFPYRGSVWLQVVSWVHGHEVSLLMSPYSIWLNNLILHNLIFFAALYCISFTCVQSKCFLVAGTLMLWMCSLLGPHLCCFIPSKILLSLALLWLQCLFQRVIEF